MPLDPTEKSATVVIRAALYARRSDLVGIARDTGVSAESFHAFLVVHALRLMCWPS